MLLVTGGTGFIGSHLTELLVARGERVRCLVRRKDALRHLKTTGVELAEGDLASGGGLELALRGVDTVLHLAGVTKARFRDEYYNANARGTANLLGACGDVRRFVHVSSLAAAGPSLDGTPMSENVDPHPVSHYGRSKLEGEMAVRRSALAARSVIVRPPVVYGPRDTDVFHMFRAASRGLLLEIGRTERFFSIIYVKDLAEGILAAAGGEIAAGRTYHLAHPQPVSWAEFGATACAILNRKARIIRVPRSAAWVAGACAEAWSRLSGRPGILSREKVREACCTAWTCDTRHAREDLAFVARTSLAEGMAATVAWYREARWLA